MLKATGFVVIFFFSFTVKFKDVYLQTVEIHKGERKLFGISQVRSLKKKGENRIQTTILQKIETPFSLRPAIGKKKDHF